MHSDTETLQEEIRRLNTIVRLLADRNGELESELARLQHLSAASAHEGGSKTPSISPSANAGGGNGVVNMPLLNAGGVNQPPVTPLPGSGRMERQLFTPSPLPGGHEQAQITPSAYSGGSNWTEVTPLVCPARMDFMPVAPTPAFPEALPSEETLIRILKKEGMGNVHNKGVKRAATLLLWAAREPGPITYEAMCKRLGLTESGASKLISSLRRRGLLERSGWQRLRLSNAARALMKKPVAAPPNGNA